MTLKCPRTQTDMKKITLDGVQLDISTECGGVWFDNFEIKKMDELQEKAGDQLMEILEAYGKAPVDHSQKIRCPKCLKVTLMRSFYSPQRSIEIDTCAACGGVWLDAGELRRLRALFKTEEEKDAYAQEFVNEVSAKFLGEDKDKLQASQDQARKIAKIFRYICPSNYIKGKQDWGAF